MRGLHRLSFLVPNFSAWAPSRQAPVSAAPTRRSAGGARRSRFFVPPLPPFFRGTPLPPSPRCAARAAAPPRPRGMAWTCSAATHRDLTAALAAAGLLTSPRLIDAFRSVDRAAFVPPRSVRAAYADAPQGIGWGATISAPHMHAMCVELLGGVLGLGGGGRVAPAGGGRGGGGGGGAAVAAADGGGNGGAPETGDRVLDVLDVGVGSGFLAGVLAVALGDRGRVVGIDHVAELVTAAHDSLTRAGVSAVVATAAAADGGGGDAAAAAPPRPTPAGTVELHAADGRAGLPGRTWDAIHVGAAADGGVPPPALVAALKVGGRMVVPVGGGGGGAATATAAKCCWRSTGWRRGPTGWS
ncbi:hypothetical protein BU14_0897s0005 [Porphyra umbilicalis]|uniref:protein-L-isoaspartate(D-aspartate) O-methyltransferase n=1 Tax=Porphyra umbilicalis TaxID=2786 RepID=A0A1X6NNQ2_PORUM|nr:hypothetical protein BU14_0897s0005 [Porphyra umbilicalis]|eukprot:OSX70116.1 hypothetical protein BU14_0897s0005 [Porphyra umbilicalis]